MTPRSMSRYVSALEVECHTLRSIARRERLGHEHRRGCGNREDRWAFGFGRDRRAGPTHDRSGHQRDRRPHEVDLTDDVATRRAERVVHGDPHHQRQRAGNRTSFRRRRQAADEERRQPPRGGDVPQDAEQPPADDPVRQLREDAEPHADADRDQPQAAARAVGSSFDASSDGTHTPSSHRGAAFFSPPCAVSMPNQQERTLTGSGGHGLRGRAGAFAFEQSLDDVPRVPRRHPG